MYLIIPMLALLLSACSSTQYSLKPTEEPTFWNQGVGYNKRANKVVSYSVGGGEVIYGGIQFNVQIENKSPQTLNVDSQIFNLISGTDLIKADNPEVLLSSIDKEMSTRKSRYDPFGTEAIGTLVDIGNYSKEAKKRDAKREKNLADFE